MERKGNPRSARRAQKLEVAAGGRRAEQDVRNSGKGSGTHAVAFSAHCRRGLKRWASRSGRGRQRARKVQMRAALTCGSRAAGHLRRRTPAPPTARRTGCCRARLAPRCLGSWPPRCCTATRSSTGAATSLQQPAQGSGTLGVGSRRADNGQAADGEGAAASPSFLR